MNNVGKGNEDEPQCEMFFLIIEDGLRHNLE